MNTLRLAPWAMSLVAAVLMAGPAQAQYYPRPYFSPNGGGADATAERIDAARDTVDVAMYSISTSGPIWNSLRDAVQRGVRVRVLLNKGTSSNKSKAKALENIGVHVFTVSKTLHEKYALIDAGTWYRRKLVNGSANWSSSAENRHSENTVVYGRHYHLFYAFQQEYNHLLSISRPASAGAQAHNQPVSLNRPSTYTRRYERALFSSANMGNGTTVIADAIVAMMQTAETSIQIDVAHFNSQQIAQGLIAVAQAKPNLKIEVMLDMGEYGDSKSRATDLEAAGISVRYQMYSLAFFHPRSQLQHHKTMIVDGKRMITGSYNWSETAETKNYENVIVVDDHRRNRSMIKAFVAEHDKMWNRGRDVYPAYKTAMLAQPGDAAYRKVVPIHFDTNYFRQVMSLTRSEIQPIRSAGWSAGLFERQPNGKKNVEFTYLDREARDVFHGNPSGSFLTPVGNNTGLVGNVNNN